MSDCFELCCDGAWRAFFTSHVPVLEKEGWKIDIGSDFGTRTIEPTGDVGFRPAVTAARRCRAANSYADFTAPEARSSRAPVPLRAAPCRCDPLARVPMCRLLRRPGER